MKKRIKALDTTPEELDALVDQARVALDEAGYRRFERWRNSHQRGRRPIPEKLRMAAAETARRHGVFRTAKVLGLDYTKLKQKVGTVRAREGSLTKPPAFFERQPSHACFKLMCTLRRLVRS